MNLDYTYGQIHEIITGEKFDDDTLIRVVHYDTRRILTGHNSIFFAFHGQLRNGSAFLEEAYNLGVRHFVCTEQPEKSHTDANYMIVSDPLAAIQKLAKHHRKRFDYPIIGITGSNGKTIVKEWLSGLLEGTFHVVKSPKSYNSQLGVALSLLELNEKAEIALIEAGISKPGEMQALKEMIEPTYGIFTHLGSAHLENFASKEELRNEKLKLFSDCEWIVAPNELESPDLEVIHPSSMDLSLAESSRFKDQVSIQNLSIALCTANKLGVEDELLLKRIEGLHGIVMRMEQFDGVGNNLIINDTYSMDREALISSLEHQYSIADGRKRVVIIGLERKDTSEIEELQSIIKAYEPIDSYFLEPGEMIPENIKDSIVLIKGSRKRNMESLANKLRLRNHQSYLEIDLEGIKKNIKTYSDGLAAGTKVLCMVKASSYGSDATKIGAFLTRIGVDYLGVAYTDEGVELRESGVTLPILVMNADIHSFGTCIENQLEPAIYSLEQLEELVKELIARGVNNYPIHIKLETGMHRLGFERNELDSLINYLKAQPEVYVKSVYSHLATADDTENQFALQQIETFKEIATQLKDRLPYPFMMHILNSEGAANYPQAHFDMVRLGIGMYGITGNAEFSKKLTPCIRWNSSVSQVKNLKPGDTVGYGQMFKAEKQMRSATIPIGYADGFRRSLGDGKGFVYINGQKCRVLGNVCMDMIMVDITNAEVKNGDPVEILGEHCTIQQFAELLETVPYEVLTSFSQRLPRVYIND